MQSSSPSQIRIAFMMIAVAIGYYLGFTDYIYLIGLAIVGGVIGIIVSSFLGK